MKRATIILTAVAVLIAVGNAMAATPPQIVEGYKYPAGWTVPSEWLRNGNDTGTFTYPYGATVKSWTVSVDYQEKAVNLRFEVFPLEGSQYPVWEKEVTYAPTWPSLGDRNVPGYFTVRRWREIKEKPQPPQTEEHFYDYEHVAYTEEKPPDPEPPVRIWVRGAATGKQSESGQ